MSIFQVVHKQTLLLQQIRNIFYYETTVGDPSTSEWKDIVDEIRSDLVGVLAAVYTSSWAFQGIDYRKVDVVGLLSFEAVPTAGPLAGASAGNEAATQVALLVSVKGVTTKPNRARTYLAGFTMDDMQDSLWDSSARVNAESFIDDQSVLNGGGTNPLQRVAAQWNSSHTQVIASNNISGQASVASIVPATQRRRRIGVGI